MLHVHRAERADRLVDGLAEVLATPAGDVFDPEVVAVHSRGIERWLAQELSQRLGTSGGRADGVAANIHFPFPGRIVGRALAAAAEIDADADPWPPARLVWPLLEVLDVSAPEDWLAPLRPHLATDGSGAPGRRFRAARHIADLFDRYAVHRPEMILAWAREEDVGADGFPLPADAAWQPKLWRTVREHLRAEWESRDPSEIPSSAERLEKAAEHLRRGDVDPERLDLPQRLSLFGLTALPASYVTVLSALAERRDVHLFLLHPSPTLWDRIASQGGGTAGRPPRDEDATRELPQNPLLRSWGIDAREMQLVLAGNADRDERHGPDEGPDPPTLLGRLQRDIRGDRRPPRPAAPDEADPRPILHPDDRSVQVHACHGRTRQVEVLRDAILHLLADDPDLEPRDIVVMCPDIETFAPIVHAVFGADAVVEHDGDAETSAGLPDLRVRLADRSLRKTNPVFRVVAEFLDLAGGRLTASEVLDLASREPVRRRFGFGDDDLEQLEAWVAEAGIRWGLDETHRRAYGLDGVDANTWRRGLDRILVGATMADEDERLVGSSVPLDDVEGGGVDLAGRFAELLARIANAVGSLRGRRTIDAWAGAIRALADALTATSERSAGQRNQLDRILDEIVREATLDSDVSTVELALDEVRALLDDRLRGRPTRANHRTGDLTVCTLVPMRSVPHRVVCLLGLDDGAFPRKTVPDGDDLVDRDPRVGDRDTRTEDRQLLLDAVLAAKDSLVVTYTGRDERTNEELAPAVPIGELLDTIDATMRTGDRLLPAREQVVVRHPLQPSDPRNFTPGGPLRDRPWGFDPTALAGARARAAGPVEALAFLPTPLSAPPDEDTIELDDLVRFLEHPCKSFLKRRLGVSLPRRAEEPSDAIPVQLGGLEKYAVGDRMLNARLAGADLVRLESVERARGTLPPGELADPVLDEVRTTVEQIAAAAAARFDLDNPRGSVEVVVPLPHGRTLVGTVADLVGDTAVALRYSRLAPKHRLAAWARLLAATAAHPERALSALLVGRVPYDERRKGDIRTIELPALADDADRRRDRALEELTRLIDLFDRGAREALPLYCATSAAYAGAIVDPEAIGDAFKVARKAWGGSFAIPGESADPEHVLVLGGIASFEALLEDKAGDDETGDGWPEEPVRFERYARRLWDSLLAHEQVTDT